MLPTVPCARTLNPAVSAWSGRVDVLRGFAAVAVMLHHHGQYYDELYPGRAPLSVNFFAGHFGVELFFIISGFVILMTIERKATVWAFAVARAARLMPCFLAALALATVILAIAPMPPLDTPTVGRFLANVTMAPLLFGERVVDLPYWTLSYEMVFYLSMALLLALGCLRQVEWIAIAWIAAGLAFTTLVDVEHHHRTAILLLAYYSNFFVIGMCLYLVQAGRARPVTWVALVLAILTSARGGGEQAFYASSGLYLSLTWRSRFWCGSAQRRSGDGSPCRRWSSSAASPIRSISCTSCWASR